MNDIRFRSIADVRRYAYQHAYYDRTRPPGVELWHRSILYDANNSNSLTQFARALQRNIDAELRHPGRHDRYVELAQWYRDHIKLLED